ncbi:MAG TPA: hemin uptake protein HemP [Burkholderiales bacterium]|nr:hemin uptake protein HemP [Burkholderiales bacterium]
MDLKQAPSRQAGSETERFPMRVVTSEALLGRGQELVIVHKGREYRLRLTQNGKLILTA